MRTRRVLLEPHRRGAAAIVLTAPGQPINLGATVGDTEIVLTWDAPASNGGSPITDYLVEHSPAGDDDWTTFADGTSATTGTTVTGLANGTAYDFRVSAINAIGTGSPSATATATPAAAAFDFEGDITSAVLKGWWAARLLSDADDAALASQPNLCADGLWPMEQATALSKPVVKTNIQNGLRVVRGNGSRFMATPAIAGRITGTGLTVVEVVIRRAFVSGAGLCSLYKASDGADWSSTNGPLIAHQPSTGTQENYMASGIKASIASHPADGVPMIVMTWWDGTHNHMIRRASGATITATPVATTPTFNIEALQMFKRVGGSNIAQADHCERLVYQGALDSDDRDTVLAELQDIWDIA